MKFRIGEKVVYVSGRYHVDAGNPLHSLERYKDVVGTIYTKDVSDCYFNGGKWIYVNWSNGTHNAYAEDDLFAIAPPQILEDVLFEL